MKPFPWRPGMLMQRPAHAPPSIRDWELRVARVEANGPWLVLGTPVPGDAQPDPTDPATLGALLGAVRKAWGDCTIYTRTSEVYCRWEVHRSLPAFSLIQRKICDGPTEFAALMAAWRAAP